MARVKFAEKYQHKYQQRVLRLGAARENEGFTT